jgi:hypothetical protein
MVLFPLDVVAGFIKGTYPSQATLMALLGAIIGLYLARKLWWGGSARLETEARLQFLNEQGANFNPDSEEVQVQLANARSNYLLGAGFLFSGIFMTAYFIAAYIAATASIANQTTMSMVFQIGIIIFFNLLVTAVEALGATIFLKR